MDIFAHSLFELIPQNYLVTKTDVGGCVKSRSTLEQIIQLVKEYTQVNSKAKINIVTVHSGSKRTTPVGKSPANYIYALFDDLTLTGPPLIDFQGDGVNGQTQSFFLCSMHGDDKLEEVFFAIHHAEDEDRDVELNILMTENWTQIVNMLIVYAKGIRTPDLRSKLKSYIDNVALTYALGVEELTEIHAKTGWPEFFITTYEPKNYYERGLFADRVEVFIERAIYGTKTEKEMDLADSTLEGDEQ